MKLVIFGCGHIAQRIAKGAQSVSNIELVGFASKEVSRAKLYAWKMNCPCYGDYDSFLNSDVDAVYIATYNPSHYELIKKCLQHHKHVICEKPMLSSLEQSAELFALAKENNVMLMEAMKAVFLPINQNIKALIQNGQLGKIKYMEASFIRASFFEDNHWIYDPLCGGASRDLGSYCAAILNYMADGEPDEVHLITNSNVSKADTIAEADLRYGDIRAHLFVSNAMDGNSHLLIIGEQGTIEIKDFWKAKSASLIRGASINEIEADLVNDFHYELKHFAYCVDCGRTESDLMDQKASDAILKITCCKKQ